MRAQSHGHLEMLKYPVQDSEVIVSMGQTAAKTRRVMLARRLDRLKHEQVMLDTVLAAVSRYEMELPLAIHVFSQGFLQFLA